MAPKKGGRQKAPTPAPNTVPGSDHVVFGRDDAKVKKVDSQEPAPPRINMRKEIGGGSWTGKLPVDLLAEHCQKQKWNRPHYSPRKMPDAQGGLYRDAVTLSMNNPKTRHTTRLRPFYLPQSHAHLADQETELKAKHFAAAYALFRVSSMKNIQMALPPVFRDLWKGDFARLKKEDEDAGHGWKYEADPFAAEIRGQEIRVELEKRRDDKAKADAMRKQSPGELQIHSGAPVSVSKPWQRVPKVELGQKMRSDIEEIVRNESNWNPYGITISAGDRVTISSKLASLGFHKSHVHEALKFCKDKEETLEWLLIHVPEDDLPAWAFPPGYTTGISLATTDVGKAAALSRLSLGGFSNDECAKALRAHGDELLAAQALQDDLAPTVARNEEGTDTSTSDQGTWEEEMESLEATFGDRFSFTNTPASCTLSTQISLKSMKFHFRKPPAGYPNNATPIVAIQAFTKIPAYVRLSATRQVIRYAQQSCLGYMMVWSMIEWLETNLPGILEDPGPLVPIEMQPKAVPYRSHRLPKTDHASGHRTKASRTSTTLTDDTQLLAQFEARQQLPQQVRMNCARQKLPAWAKGPEIVHAIEAHQCVIISGETGSGKSTQAVQFVLDHLLRSNHGSTANILCTQPRRISALGLGDRVSSERCSTVGEEVGYIIRGEAKVSSKTKITFMTTGVLLRRMQSSGDMSEALSDVSHIFVDEVHERSLDTDFVLALLRDALRSRKDLKLVLMSATLEADIFSDYFGGSKLVGHVHIEGRTFPVHDYYLDEILRSIDDEGTVGPPGSEGHSRSALPFGSQEDTAGDIDVGKSIRDLGMGINYDLIARLVRHIDYRLGPQRGGILIFLPGTFEIDRCIRALDMPAISPLPLHASLTPAEQRRVFLSTSKRKVVAATNVAETSITIDDIVAVIDTGRVKETTYDTANNIVRLEEVWASQAACKQRRGRAGRVQEGICYKLFTRSLESKMSPRPEPEIRRVPLEQLCLSVKATGADREVANFLAATLTPPDSAAVSNALKLLHRMNALDGGRLTALGTYLSMIPADLRCAKLLIYACVFRCLEPCLTIAAILTTKSPFISPRDKREEAKEARLAFPSSHGDLLLDVAAFDSCTRIAQETGYRGVRQWCETNFISQNTIREISSARTQLLDALKDTKLVPMSYRNRDVEDRDLNTNSGRQLFLRALIAGSLNPQVARIEFPDKKYIASMSGATEIDPEAKTIKYFNEENGRVFVHPSSALFDAQAYSSNATFITYFTKMATSKTFIRDLTPFNAYSLLLFGGPIELDTSGQGIIIDGWLRLRGWARIGVLISRLRALLDDALRQSIDAPSVPFTDRENILFNIVQRLVELNGQDQ